MVSKTKTVFAIIMTNYQCKLCFNPLIRSPTTSNGYCCSQCPDYTLYAFSDCVSEYLDVGNFVMAAYSGDSGDLSLLVYRRSHASIYLYQAKEPLTSDIARYWFNRMKIWSLLS